MLIRSPRWLVGMGGDTVGVLLQVVALATGPVVLVQPFQVLALPVSLLIAWALGGARPGWRQGIACAWMLLGLVGFFLLIGRPDDARPTTTSGVLIAAGVLAGGGVLALVLSAPARPTVKAAMYGGVAGCLFGFEAVLFDGIAALWFRDGLAGFARPAGLAPLLVVVVLGAFSIVLTQVALRAGPLAASFPANLAADPVVSVALGALLVHETIPSTPGHLLGYLAALAAIVYGAVRLAADPAATVGAT